MLITYGQMSLVNTHAVVSCKASLNFGLSLHLHGYLVLVSSEGSESLCICTDSPEPLLLADVISTKS